MLLDSPLCLQPIHIHSMDKIALWTETSPTTFIIIIIYCLGERKRTPNHTHAHAQLVPTAILWIRYIAFVAHKFWQNRTTDFTCN